MEIISVKLFRVSFYLFYRLFEDFDRKFAYLSNIDRISMELSELIRCSICSTVDCSKPLIEIYILITYRHIYIYMSDIYIYTGK